MNRRHVLRAASGQDGASLIVVLVLLLIMTILGLAVLRNTLMEERMTANLYDRSLSFQSAEAALREAEALAATAAVPAGIGGACANGICPQPSGTAADRWRVATTAWRTATLDAGSVATPSEFIIEYMGMAPTWPGCDRLTPIPALCMSPTWRITARSTAANRAEVILQTNYIRQ